MVHDVIVTIIALAVCAVCIASVNAGVDYKIRKDVVAGVVIFVIIVLVVGAAAYGAATS